jgi:hypothetical protein
VGKKFLEEACASARSLRQIMPDANIALVTNEPLAESLFDQIILHAAPNMQIKKSGLLYKVANIYTASPYQETIFVDTDTFFYENTASLFNVLNWFDLAAVPAPADLNSPDIDGEWLQTHNFNTGVIVFRKNQSNDMLFADWRSMYEKIYTTATSDQPSFMKAIARGNSRICSLSSIWNARIPYFVSLHGKVKIAHGRRWPFEVIRDKINITADQRVWHPVEGRCVTL